MFSLSSVLMASIVPVGGPDTAVFRVCLTAMADRDFLDTLDESCPGEGRALRFRKLLRDSDRSLIPLFRRVLDATGTR